MRTPTIRAKIFYYTNKIKASRKRTVVSFVVMDCSFFKNRYFKGGYLSMK